MSKSPPPSRYRAKVRVMAELDVIAIISEGDGQPPEIVDLIDIVDSREITEILEVVEVLGE